VDALTGLRDSERAFLLLMKSLPPGEKARYVFWDRDRGRFEDMVFAVAGEMG
jgi:hypothetical protein